MPERSPPPPCSPIPLFDVTATPRDPDSHAANHAPARDITLCSRLTTCSIRKLADAGGSGRADARSAAKPPTFTRVRARPPDHAAVACRGDPTARRGGGGRLWLCRNFWIINYVRRGWPPPRHNALISIISAWLSPVIAIVWANVTQPTRTYSRSSLFRLSSAGNDDGAGALFRDGRGNILLVDPVYRDTWDLPGGVIDADESPNAACRARGRRGNRACLAGRAAARGGLGPRAAEMS